MAADGAGRKQCKHNNMQNKKRHVHSLTSRFGSTLRVDVTKAKAAGVSPAPVARACSSSCPPKATQRSTSTAALARASAGWTSGARATGARASGASWSRASIQAPI